MPQQRIRQVILWILCLSMVAVGLRNFEPGLTSDAPIYSTIARNIDQHHEWFRLETGVDDYKPYFADHPHLGFWLLALVFKLLPAQDWSARILGILFYIATLSLLFFYIRWRSSERVAVWTVLLLWTWSRFSNFYSNVYLDPGYMFFGIASLSLLDAGLYRRLYWLSGVAGVSLALSVMYKDLAATGFVPAWLILILLYFRREKKLPVLQLACALTTLALTLFAYWLAVHLSSAPDFFQIYWTRQITSRVSKTWQWLGIFTWRGWPLLLKDTNYFLFLAPLAFFFSKDRYRLLIPLLLFLGFVGMFASNNLAGTQYWIAVMPWAAWLIAEGLFSKISWPVSSLLRVTSTLSIAAVFIVQFIPWNMRRLPPPEEIPALRAVAKGPIVLIVPKEDMNFLTSSRFVWYGYFQVHYLQEEKDFKSLNVGNRMLYLYADNLGDSLLKRRGLCERQRFSRSQLWVPCQS